MEEGCVLLIELLTTATATQYQNENSIRFHSLNGKKIQL